MPGFPFWYTFGEWFGSTLFSSMYSSFSSSFITRMLCKTQQDIIGWQMSSKLWRGTSLSLLNRPFRCLKALYTVWRIPDNLWLNFTCCFGKIPKYLERGDRPVVQWISIISKDVMVLRKEFLSFSLGKHNWVPQNSCIVHITWPTGICIQYFQLVVHYYL